MLRVDAGTILNVRFIGLIPPAAQPTIALSVPGRQYTGQRPPFVSILTGFTPKARLLGHLKLLRNE